MDSRKELLALYTRLNAIEYQLGRVYNIALTVAGANEETIAQSERSVIDSFENAPLGQGDPAQASLLIGEFQDALHKLFQSARDHRLGKVAGRMTKEP